MATIQFQPIGSYPAAVGLPARILACFGVSSAVSRVVFSPCVTPPLLSISVTGTFSLSTLQPCLTTGWCGAFPPVLVTCAANPNPAHVGGGK